ncbi:MAG: ABC transporter ATP-binding protein [Spirochaetota bacterium]|nr:ABC transporter ATP-binding protein [Spirochaetota bacterium]
MSKHYGNLKAVDNISFEIHEGEIFGILGPNGAGKTTTLEIMEGLRKADDGTIIIDNKRLDKDYNKIKEIIGVQLQSTSIYNKIKVEEALKLFGSYYKTSLDVDTVLETLSLTEKRKTYYINLSGGQKQRLSLGIAIINNPKIVFLDEPTAGVDPQARRNLWEIILKMKEEGRTVVITTHYMEEAQYLCDRVAIMDMGRIIDIDSPQALIKKQNLQSSIHFPMNGELLISDLHNIVGVIDVKILNGKATLFTHDPIKTLTSLMDISKQKNCHLDHMMLKEPNLEDLFIELTGRDLRE